MGEDVRKAVEPGDVDLDRVDAVYEVGDALAARGRDGGADDEGVSARAAGECVVAFIAVEPVVALGAFQCIGARAPEDRVSTRRAGDRVVARIAVDSRDPSKRDSREVQRVVRRTSLNDDVRVAVGADFLDAARRDET